MKHSLLALLLFSAAMAEPPPVPSAGIVERQLEQEYEGEELQPEKAIPNIQIEIPKERMHLPAGESIYVEFLRICGNESIPTKKILAWAGFSWPSEAKDLTLADIYDICHRIEEGYAKEGYFLTRVYPPPQDIEGGCLILQILEGKLGQITVVGNKYHSAAFVESYFRKFQHKTLRYGDFLEALLLLNENKNLAAGVVFEKGKEFGTADLIIQVSDQFPLHLYLNVNNYGRDLTTNYRGGGRIESSDLLCYGDLFSIAEVVGFPFNALYFTDARYRFPFNRSGGFIEGNYLFSIFNIEELFYLHLKGKSTIGTLKVTQACVRTKSLSIDAFGYFDFKQFRNFAMGKTVSFDKLRVITAGMLLDHYHPKFGRDHLNVRVAAGIPRLLGGLPAVSSLCSRAGAGGRFVIFNGDYDRIQTVGPAYFYLHASGQYSPYKLAQPEQIYIGGPDTVRGFPLAAALGDSGYYCNVECRVPIPFLYRKKFCWTDKTWGEILQLAAFFDQGGMFSHDLYDTFLTGVGFGVRFNGPKAWFPSLTVDIGYPLNHREKYPPYFVYLKVTSQPF